MLQHARAGRRTCRILFHANFSGRGTRPEYRGLSEVITFNWSPPAADRVTLAGIEYMFREAPPKIRREPCDWHFEAVPYEIAMERQETGGESQVLRMHFGPTRVDCFALMSSDMAGFEHPKFGS